MRVALQPAWLLPSCLRRRPGFPAAKLAYKYTTAIEAGRLVVRYEIADGYYLYRDRLGFETTTPGVNSGRPGDARRSSTTRTTISASR